MEYDRLNATNSDLQAEVNKANQAHRLANQEREDLLFKLEQEEKTKQSISSDLVQVQGPDNSFDFLFIKWSYVSQLH